jgi:hypothetical protein
MDIAFEVDAPLLSVVLKKNESMGKTLALLDNALE